MLSEDIRHDRTRGIEDAPGTVDGTSKRLVVECQVPNASLKVILVQKSLLTFLQHPTASPCPSGRFTVTNVPLRVGNARLFASNINSLHALVPFDLALTVDNGAGSSRRSPIFRILRTISKSAQSRIPKPSLPDEDGEGDSYNVHYYFASRRRLLLLQVVMKISGT